MFTGLIEEIGTLVKLDMSGASGLLTVAVAFPPGETALGDSIAVNGVCLTVSRKGPGTLAFDVSPETIERSALKSLKNGSPLNLERALSLSGRLAGHIVTGHVDCVAVVAERREIAGNTVFSFRMPHEQLKYVAAKGSVAVDGISLTVNTVAEEGFSVNIIPHTAQKTNLSYRQCGDQVNIETDILARYVERLLIGRTDGKSSGITLELLAKSGFM
jgi:riboflavin synthase